MCKTVAILFGVLASVGLGWLPAPAKGAGQQDQTDQVATVDQLAQRIFTNADQNHNHVLNKIEFRNAQSMLESAVAEWGRGGIIGKPKKPGNKDNDSEHAPGSAAASASKLARSNKISQAEFAFYVHSVVEEADQQWRKMNAAAASQRKAMSAQRRVYPTRGRRFVPYPYPY
ncbi:MAG: hypothetical protein HY288_00280 [Planctomycetia bacterium]|nr:hypothetical protein [Planctomycetia bacterium]